MTRSLCMMMTESGTVQAGDRKDRVSFQEKVQYSIYALYALLQYKCQSGWRILAQEELHKKFFFSRKMEQTWHTTSFTVSHINAFLKKNLNFALTSIFTKIKIRNFLIFSFKMLFLVCFISYIIKYHLNLLVRQ